MNEIVLLFLEKICEAIYFSAFLIIAKGIKEKRILFTAIMIFEYLALKYFIHYNIWFQLAYTFMSFLTLKVLYKDKAQVTDIFLFAIASLFLVLLSILCGLILFNYPELYFLMLVINRILIFTFIIAFKNKINYIYNEVRKYWNRHKNPQKIKSLTLRNISVIIFNLMFYILNICMLIAVAFIEKR